MTNSKPRHYYTDPLAAVWMAKHFGMRFVGRNEDVSKDLSDFFFESQTGAVIPAGGRCVIHPDSLHLLEPQEGDKGTDTRGWPCIFVGGDGGWWGCINIESGCIEPEPEPPVVIEKRNGLAFHWPESEAA